MGINIYSENDCYEDISCNEYFLDS